MTHEETTTEIKLPNYTPKNDARKVVRVQFGNPQSQSKSSPPKDLGTVWALRLLAVVSVLLLSLLFF